MKHKTKLKLAAIQQVCDAQDKSTEYMIQVMMDMTGIEIGGITSYLELPTDEKQLLFEEVNIIVNTINTLVVHMNLTGIHQ